MLFMLYIENAYWLRKCHQKCLIWFGVAKKNIFSETEDDWIFSCCNSGWAIDLNGESLNFAVYKTKGGLIKIFQPYGS